MVRTDRRCPVWRISWINPGLHWEHDDVIKWKHFPRYWPFVRGIHRSPVNSTHKGRWRGALMFSLICVWIKCWVNNREAGDLRRYRAHYDVTVMVEILWRWPIGLWLVAPVCRIRFKNLLMAPCVTPVIQAIPICRRASRDSLTMSCNISPEIWRGIVWTFHNPD